MASKENPLKPNVALVQSTNTANQNITPSPGHQIVRRSSRLFGSTQSVKENSKQQAPKKAIKNNAPKSPSARRPKGRVALATHQEAEKNEKNKSQEKDKDKSEKDLDDAKKPAAQQQQAQQQQQQQVNQAAAALANLNLGAHALVIQKQSLEGLLQLLRQFGTG